MGQRAEELSPDRRVQAEEARVDDREQQRARGDAEDAEKRLRDALEFSDESQTAPTLVHDAIIPAADPGH